MKAKHTPGPWTEPRVYKNPDGTAYRATVYCIGQNGRMAATLANPDETDLANLRLISAAPDLLAALEKILAAVNCNYDPLVIKSEGYAALAEAAIQKALGEGENEQS